MAHFTVEEIILSLASCELSDLMSHALHFSLLGVSPDSLTVVGGWCLQGSASPLFSAGYLSLEDWPRLWI